MTKSKNANDAAVAKTSRNNLPSGRIMPMIAVIRMCSARWKATTDPSIASHRNRMPASSSDQSVEYVAGDDADKKDDHFRDDQ